MHFVLKTAMASALALAAAAPVAAQPYGGPPGSPAYGAPPYGSPYRPTDQYQQEQRQYDRDRARWESQQDSYQAARADYERRRADYEARRADYDARYGYGAYARAYGPAPTWDDRQWAYSRPAPAPAAGYYGSDAGYAAPIKCNNNSAVTAGLLGAIAGGVLGSNVAGRGDRTEGAVLGGLVGGGIGAAVGHANDKYKCDQQGAYWSYNDTVPYRVDDSIYRDDRASNYSQRGCRLAPAPVNSTDTRYVRVCPDGSGRYRIAG